MPRRPGLLLLAGLLACLPAWGCATGQPAGPADRQLSPEASSQPQSRAAAVVSESARALRELRKSTRDQVLDHALEDARAVIVLPGVYQAGFFYSLHGGDGVLVARRPDGGWSAPVLMSMGGAGYGYQIGLEKSRVVLVVLEDEMLTRILDSGLSFDATAGFDILGARHTTGPDSRTYERPVLAFSDGVGAMAGVAFHGGMLSVNEGLTEAYHGGEAGGSAAILKGAHAPGLEAFELWSALYVDAPAAGAPQLIRP